jgi:sulfur carrier protein ThiS
VKVRVSLYGTLGQGVAGYNHSRGIEVEIPDDATVKDFLNCLEFTKPEKLVVVRDGRVLKGDDKMQWGIPVNVFQAIHGG